MRDLKHLIYFENLLQQANNDLVQDACKDGRLALAWNCSYIPEVLLDTDNCFGVRLRAPHEPRHGHLLHDQPLVPVLQEHPRACV